MSLEEIGLRKLVVLLWSHPRNLNSLKSFRFSSEDDNVKVKEWNAEIEKVKDQVGELKLPKTLEKKIMLLLKPVGSELIKWRSFHENYVFWFECCSFVDLIIWTFQGTIDYRKSAENIIKQGNELTLAERFMLSCLYCLEDDVQAIWKKFSDEEKSSCIENTSHNPRHKELIAFWASSLSSDVNLDDYRIKEHISHGTVCPFVFENVTTTGNYVATQYFFSKLPQEQRGRSLAGVAQNVAEKCSFWMTTYDIGYPKESYSDILCYLLTLMTEKEQMEVFRSHPYKVLLSFLDWPRQRVFLQLLEKTWTFLTVDQFHKLMCVLSRDLNFSAYNYTHLFQEVFLQIPALREREHLLADCEEGTFLAHLFDCDDEENIKLVIRNVEPLYKEEIFIHESGFSICYKLIEEDKWHLLEVFIQECMPSRNARERVKNNFSQFVPYYPMVEREDKMAKFFNMLDNTNAVDCIIQNLEENGPPAKKFKKE
ncbi:hypothetical protein AVEN_219358-1 [Araneus ventricosus]|uniref:Uncharacterized protein n=1 Tax=Araneus ventricosus TaxID=182803 RepID=A0A4Y2BFD9_ARAVE|nr:hypothetical protein AVEN_219358-1 [Araneus ventricosus]